MGLIQDLPEILEKSEKLYETLKNDATDLPFHLTETVKDGKNILVNSDNLNYMRHLLNKGMAGKIDLIYIDPPFFSKADYTIDVKIGGKKLSTIEHRVYSDTWDDGMKGYMEMLALRLKFMWRLLSDTGSIFIHIDWHSSHYVKILMDEIFGIDNFVNEIIWTYKSGGVSKRYFARKHDTVFFYSKSKNYFFDPLKEKSYNRGLKPYRFKGVKEYKDETGWYTLVNMKDVWQIDMVGRTSAERTGYATQKPEALIERILLSATKPGDLCADFFCGSGTLGAVAAKMGRQFILCDEGKAACMKAHRRLAEIGAGHSYYEAGASSEPLGIIKISKEQSGDLAGSTIIRITDYNYTDIKKIDIDRKQDKELKYVLKHSWAQLIEYWCIDLDYQGKEINADMFFSKGKNDIPVEAVIINQKINRIAIRVMDVFGNEAVYIEEE